ncbi:MAG: hypothetical protein HC897_19775 [Thermoanaerobaculia bacterium]|nr:hypothetical protein [Thermoanaerobaculia bacterium]
MFQGRGSSLSLDRWSFGALVIIFLAWSLPFFCLSEQLLRNLPADDLFYYLESARRTATTGAWPSMDGAQPTSGFQPLFFLVCVLLEDIGQITGLTSLYLVLGLNWVLAIVSMLLIARLVVDQTDRSLQEHGAIAAGSRRFAVLGVLACLFFNPFWAAQALTGVETMLSLVLWVWLLGRWSYRKEPAALADRPWRALIVDGAILGLLGLARTDNAFLAVGFGLAFLTLVPRRSGAILARLAAMATVAGLVVLPWCLALLGHQGSIVQDSARALLARHALEIASGWIGPWEAIVRQIGLWFYRLAHVFGGIPLTATVAGLMLGVRFRLKWRWLRSDGLLAAAAIAGLLELLSANTVWDVESLEQLAAELGVGAAFFVLALICPAPVEVRAQGRKLFLTLPAALSVGSYVILLGHFQLWYVASPALLLVLLTGPTLARNLASAHWLPAGLLMVAVATSFGGHTLRTITAGTYRELRAEALPDTALRARLEARYPTRAMPVVGSFDSGLLSYRIHPYPIANLDGVMNHAAAVALEENRFEEFLEQSRLEIVVGSEARVRYFATIAGFEAERDPEASLALGMDVFRVEGRPEGRP